ncbi:mitochondrial glutamate carrier 1-like [Styela clava]
MSSNEDSSVEEKEVEGRGTFTTELPARVLNGGIAGLTGVTCTFPLDLVKTRLHDQTKVNGEVLYKNTFDCFVKVFKNEGFFGMYRGSGVNLLLIMPEKAIKLAANDTLRHSMSQGGHLSLMQEVAAGAGAGLFQVIVTTPMEMLKIHGQLAGKLAAQSTVIGQKGTLSIQSKSTLSVAKGLLQTKGISGLYKGLSVTLMRDIPFSVIYFPLFAHLNAIGLRRRDDTRSPFFVSLFAGMIAGATAAVSVNPIDVVKTRIQTLAPSTNNREYKGVKDCARRIYKEEGLKAFFRGALPRAMVIAPLFGIAQGVYFLGIGEYILGVKQLRPV